MYTQCIVTLFFVLCNITQKSWNRKF